MKSEKISKRFQKDLQRKIHRKNFLKVFPFNIFDPANGLVHSDLGSRKALFPFTIYLCEQGFLALVAIKTESKNLVDPHNDLYCTVHPPTYNRLKELTHKMKQHNGSHLKTL